MIDTRESPALDIIEGLKSKGATLTYHDPHVPSITVTGESYESAPLDAATLEGQDCVVVVTDHDAIDMATVVDHAPLVFDTRNAVSPGQNVVKL